MREIRCVGGVVLVDDSDYEQLVRFRWSIEKHGIIRYASRQCGGHLLMHRVLVNAGKKDIVDHIDSNGLNNQRLNLRLCSHADNMSNRRKHCSTKSTYKGINKSRQKWMAQISINGTNKYLGLYETEIEAAIQYDQAARYYYGEFAKLNFPSAGEQSCHL